MFHGKQCVLCVRVCLWFFSSRQQLSPPLVICSHLQSVSVMVWYTLEQRVFLYDPCVKYGSAGKFRRKFRRKFCDERVPSRQTIHTFLNKLRTTGLLIHKKQRYKRGVLTEEKLHDIWARLEHTPRKSMKRLAQEIGVSKSSARTATQLLKPSCESWCLLCCKCKEGLLYLCF
jgi:hypothetical protein